MRLVYGPYTFPLGQCEVLPSMQSRRDESGRAYMQDWTITVNGLLLSQPSGPSLSTADTSMRNSVLNSRATSLILYDDSGLPTSINFPNDGTVINPVECVALSYPEGKAGELVTKRTFSATFVLTRGVNSRANTLLSYSERIMVAGNGGPQIRWQPAVNGPPVPVQVFPETTVRVTVSGSASGYDRYPSVPPGPFAAALLQNPQFSFQQQSPKWFGGNVHREFPVSWSYVYEGLASNFPSRALIPRIWTAVGG